MNETSTPEKPANVVAFESLTGTQPALPLTTQDGQPLPPPGPVPNRKRTSGRWRAEHPELYFEVRDRILGGDCNVSALAAEYAPQMPGARPGETMTVDGMRRAIASMINEDIGIDEFRKIKQLRAEIVEAEMLDKVSELGAKAKKADLLGAAAMSMKLTRDTLNSMGGAPTVVIRHEHTIHTGDAVAKRREEMRRRLAERSEGKIVDLNQDGTRTEEGASSHD